MSLLHWMGVWWACSAPTPAELEARGDAATDVHARAEAYAAACEGGAISACVTLALLEEAPDSARLRAAERGCEAGEPDACLARRADPGDGWTARACEAGRGHACLEVASLASNAKDRARWLAQACHLAELTACAPAALAWREQGHRARSIELARVACEGGVEHGCWMRQRLEQEQGRASGCAAGDAAACLALCLEDGQQCGRVRIELESACDEGVATACTRRGMWGFTQDHTDVGEWLWRGCDHVDPWACLLLADRLDEGAPRPPRARGDAEWLRNQACDLQLDYGCAKLP